MSSCEPSEAETDALRESAIFAVEPSSRFMRDALAALERGILDGTLRHDGDPVLREHLAWTAADRADSGELATNLERVSGAMPGTNPLGALLAQERGRRR